MPINDRPRVYPLTSTWTHADGTKRITPNGSWTESDYQVWVRNDPTRKLYASSYYRAGSYLSSLPHVNGRLSWTGRVDGIPGNNIVVSTGFGWVLPTVSWLKASESNRATLLNNAIKGAKEEQVNVALFIGELNKTSELLSSTAEKIGKAATEVRKGKFHQAARTLGIDKPKKARRSKKYADNWLEYSYGWTPLVLDMVGAMQHLHRGARGLYINARSRTSQQKPVQAWNGQVEIDKWTSSLHRLLCQWQVTGEWHVHEQVRLVYRLNEQFWDQVSRLGFMDPGTLVLESIPLSFVAEWFVNIGDVLRDLNTGLTLEYVTCCYTEYHRATGNVKSSPVWTGLNYSTYKYTTIDAHSISPSWERYQVRRTVVPWNEVLVTWALSAPLSVNKAITSVSLVAQRLP